MAWLPIIIALIAGFLFGFAVGFVLKSFHTKTAKEIAGELLGEVEAHQKENLDAVLADMKASFGSLSLDALTKSTEEFLKLAKAKLDSARELNTAELEGKKGLIDEQLKRMTSELGNVSKLVKDLENDRVEKFGQLTNQLKSAGEQTAVLVKTTGSLREALASTKIRGQWGERMAEDVLRMVGFIENVNYLKQKSVKEIGTRPDFTFILPRDHKLNMDVKFPLDNYIKFLEADSDLEKTKFKKDFLKDVKARIKEVTSREYINPEQNTLDYVLLFIPNEQVYAFIHEQDSSILDDGIKEKVVLCSPITLFAVLAVIRQAMDNFSLEQTSNEILSLLGMFNKQWSAFCNKLDQVGKRIGDAQKEYETLMTTRRRQLERPLNKIEELRKQRQIAQEPLPDKDLLL